MANIIISNPSPGLSREEILEYQNDTLKAFIIDIWNAVKDERFDIIWDAHDYVKQLNKAK